MEYDTELWQLVFLNGKNYAGKLKAGIPWKDITRPQEPTTGGLHKHKPPSASGSRKPGVHRGPSSDHLFFIKGPTGTPVEVMCAGSVVKFVLEAGKDGFRKVFETMQSMTWKKYPKTQFIVVVKVHFYIRVDMFG